MKSNVCIIENGIKDLDAILKESEKVAVYNDLTHKQTLQLRLICEEIDGMLPNIIDNFCGAFWIEFENGVCKVNVSIKIPEFNTEKKEELIGLAKNKKNSAVVGIVDKIRDSIENFFLDETSVNALSLTSGTAGFGAGYGEYVDYAYLWRLNEYRSTVSQEEKKDAWDELEKSVIAAVADDVIVGVKGKRADVIVVKNFT